MSWFTNIDEVEYSVVEFITGLGTLYSIPNAGMEYKKLWQSLANTVQSSVRDIFLVVTIGEIPQLDPAVILHTMADLFTDEVFEIYHHKPLVKVDSILDKDLEYVLVAESSQGTSSSQIFRGKAKGVFHFHGTALTGKLVQPKYAPNGEEIRLDLPQGLYNGAQVTFSWKWTKDYEGKPNRPEATFGFIQLEAGTPTMFKLSNHKGAGGWDGYDFSGKIMSKDQIVAKTTVAGEDIEIVFSRESKT